jgi:hypothetical protein
MIETLFATIVTACLLSTSPGGQTQCAQYELPTKHRLLVEAMIEVDTLDHSLRPTFGIVAVTFTTYEGA